MRRDGIADFLHSALRSAHERDKSVGGLFNAYEKVLHYEIFTACLRDGLWEATQEARLGKGQQACELKVPLDDGTSAWIEMKMWWFLNRAYESPYTMEVKSLSWPALDWERLQDLTPGTDTKVLLLMRCWDDDAARARADRWLQRLDVTMKDMHAPEGNQFELASCAYKGRKHIRHGDLHVWAATSVT